MPAKGWRKRQIMQWIPSEKKEQPEQEPVAWQVKYRDDEGMPQIAWFPHPVHPKSPLAKKPYTEEPLYTAPPQPKPEQESKLNRFVWFKTANGWRKEEFEKTLVKKVPLDTTPPEPKPHVWFDFSNCDRYSSKEEFEKTLLNNVPQREWQSLTDDEIKEIIGSYSGPIKSYTRELFDKIEAKLREKNYV